MLVFWIGRSRRLLRFFGLPSYNSHIVATLQGRPRFAGIRMTKLLKWGGRPTKKDRWAEARKVAISLREM